MSGEPLFSQHWHRVRHLRPRLAADVVVRQHLYRGVPSYVLHRPTTCSYQRLSAPTYAMLGRLDGTVTVDQAWKETLARPGEDVPTQPDMLDLLARLHEADLLAVDTRLDADGLFARGDARSRRERRQRYLNPLTMRFALFDPDRLVSALHRPLARVSGRLIAAAYVATLLCALFVSAPQWSTLRHELATVDFLSPRYAGLFLVIYPLMKVLHELAHALVLKRFGGSVHEAGVALLVLLPVPYVDCSAACLLADKRARILVSAAGILCELLLAAIAALLWSTTQGTAHAVALLVMVIGTLSTLLFNGNPLLRFDGYYVLADAVEIPNLATRSRETLLALGRSLFTGEARRLPPGADRAERRWLIGYGLLATPFRIALTLSIALMLSERYFFFGVALAVWVVAGQLALPLWRVAGFAVERIREGQWRASLLGASALALALVAVAVMPLPHHTLADGVVWLPERVQLLAPRDCEVVETSVAPGTLVRAGTPLLRCHDETLAADLGAERSRLAELAAERAGVLARDRVRARVLGARLEEIEARIEDLQRRRDAELLSAPTEGRYATVSGESIEGRFFRQGELMGFVVPERVRSARAVVRQADIAALESAPRSVELRLAAEPMPHRTYPSEVVRRVPEADRRVLSAALTSVGGGRLAASDAAEGTLVDEAVFDVELRWPDEAPPVGVGSRLRVRFEHEPRPLLPRAVTVLRRTLLGRATP